MYPIPHEAEAEWKHRPGKFLRLLRIKPRAAGVGVVQTYHVTHLSLSTWEKNTSSVGADTYKDSPIQDMKTKSILLCKINSILFWFTQGIPVMLTQ